ncbi:transcription elongation factor GreB [Alphaproteobacteria bacterium]|nr:transcription elongation factor GreB [Alphaproteobacteria bacterium]
MHCGQSMSKAFTKENDDAEDEDSDRHLAIPGGKNYITRSGYELLQAELRRLRHEDRPKVVEIVSWAAGNGDRSENGDYLYGKKRLREIDRRIRFLSKRIEIAEIVDPALQKNRDRAFFGARVTYENARGEVKTVTIVGADEVDSDRGRISWLSPVAKALLKAREGDEVSFRSPGGVETLEVLKIEYP